ncbi:G-protein coupled receptor 4 [Channa argus]|uniref:G-protein coupled receptor 4 n=1 Tax=Channa argus TaxID=215402 RepID=A0A6G1QZX3_CHAAH|nr:G-protein coupled receptor 4 [Channa argus]
MNPHSNITLNDSYDYYYNSCDYNSTDDYEIGSSVDFFYVLTWIIISVGFPLTLMAIYAVFSLVRKDHVAPIYVINLLISDLMQFCCMIADMVQYLQAYKIFFYIHLTGLMASVCFMVCIALERYLVIAWPLWYRHRRTIKISVVVCFVVWAIPVTYTFLGLFWNDELFLFGIFLLLPFPLLIFFLGATIKALSAAISVPSEEKLRIVGLLVLVLLIYTLLFLPSAILALAGNSHNNFVFINVSFLLVKLSPLADLFMYVFLRKGAVNKLLASVCCCRTDHSDISRSTMNDKNTVSSL